MPHEKRHKPAILKDLPANRAIPCSFLQEAAAPHFAALLHRFLQRCVNVQEPISEQRKTPLPSGQRNVAARR
jgi:hypothetical protein